MKINYRLSKRKANTLTDAKALINSGYDPSICSGWTTHTGTGAGDGYDQFVGNGDENGFAIGRGYGNLHDSGIYQEI